MDAPKCRLCGKREWNHVCVRVVPIETFTEEALSAIAAGLIAAEKPSRAKFDRVTYQREYMRKRRAKPAAD